MVNDIDHGHQHQHPHHNSRVLGRMIQVGRAEPQMPRHCVPHLLPPHQRHCQRHHHHHLHHPILNIITRSYAALRAADLDWIVGPGYSLGGYIMGKTMKTNLEP